MAEFGKFEMEDLRNCWTNEAKNFTPWLVKNIKELAKVIGIDSIEVVEKEFRVGKYFCDIVGKAKKGREDVDIVIENQLEISDHIIDSPYIRNNQTFTLPRKQE